MSSKELLQENRTRGWSSVSETAPAWALQQIIAFRAAALDGREFRMSPRMIREAETRSALAQKALGFVKHVFRSNSTKSYEQQIFEATGYDVSVMRAKAARQAAEIRRDERHLTALKSEARLRKERAVVLAGLIHDIAGDL